MTFGARLTAARRLKKLTQEGLGKGLGTDGKDASKAVVYGWEKDQHFPRVDQLVLICKKLDASADNLLFGHPTIGALPADLAELVTSINALHGPARDFVIGAAREALSAILKLSSQSALDERSVGKQPEAQQEQENKTRRAGN